jgi:hypothetical protein
MRAGRAEGYRVDKREGQVVNEAGVIAKVTQRLVPLMYALYFASYIDRSNLSFAALTMNEALGWKTR